MLLSDKQRIVKAINPDFKDKGSSSCKTGKNMQLGEIIEPGNFDNFDNKSSSSSNKSNNNKIIGENISENKTSILLLNSLNLGSASLNKIIKTDKIINTNNYTTI